MRIHDLYANTYIWPDAYRSRIRMSLLLGLFEHQFNFDLKLYLYNTENC